MKECNIGGGAATFKSSQVGGLPGFSSTTSEEKWISGRWSPGRLEVKRKRIFNFQAGGSMLLESVFGGVLFTQCGDIPLLMTGSNNLNCMQESESEFKKATVFGEVVNIGLFVVFDVLASVLDKESVDLKVLVQMKMNKIQRDSL